MFQIQLIRREDGHLKTKSFRQPAPQKLNCIKNLHYPNVFLFLGGAWRCLESLKYLIVRRIQTYFPCCITKGDSSDKHLSVCCVAYSVSRSVCVTLSCLGLVLCPHSLSLDQKMVLSAGLCFLSIAGASILCLFFR